MVKNRRHFFLQSESIQSETNKGGAINTGSKTQRQEVKSPEIKMRWEQQSKIEKNDKQRTNIAREQEQILKKSDS